ASSVSTGMPRQVVSSLDQRVTQWMSTVTVWADSAWNSGQVQDLSVSPPCRIENVHSGSGVWGVGPADSTGKSWVTYWPGGTRPCSPAEGRRRRRKPREMGLLMVGYLLSCSARDRVPAAGSGSRRPR